MLWRSAASAKGSLSQLNFSTARSHDNGLPRPPSYPNCSRLRVRPSLVLMTIRVFNSCGYFAVEASSGRTSTRNVESRLEDVAPDGLDILDYQAIVALQLEHGFQNRLAVN